MGKFLINDVFFIGLPVLLSGIACAISLANAQRESRYEFQLRDEGNTNRSRSGGTLEVRAVNSSIWLPICWTPIDLSMVGAAVACYRMGLNGTHVVASPGERVTGTTTQTVKTVFFDGGGNHSTTTCNGRLLHVQCHPDQPDDFAVRLTGGSSNNRGMLEIKVGGEWGSVCEDTSNFDSNAVAVVCQQLDFGRRGWMNSPSWESSSAINLLDLECTGHEANLMDCPHVYIGEDSCNYSYDILMECPLPGDYVPRLQDGFDTVAHNGRLEVNISGQWLTVYATVTANQARLACAEMGYPSSHARVLPRGTFDSGYVPGVSFSVYCLSSVQNFSDCVFPDTVISPTNVTGAAGIFCLDEKEYGVRLTGGDAKEGRLEVKIGGVWGTVCDHGFGHNEAKVACRQLENNSISGDPRLLVNRRRFGRAPTDQVIFLNNLRCNGYETSLSYCSHSFSTRGVCTHSEDVAISCDVQEEMEVQLVEGADNHSGRVEVRLEDEWGTVCNDSFDNHAAKVICRQLSLPYSRARKGSPSEYVSGSGRIWLDGVKCTGNERNFSQCHHNPFGENACNHSEDVYIHCLEKPKEMAVQLVEGADKHSGRVEVRVDDEWGTVCDDSFDNHAAKVVCKQLHLPYTGARKGLRSEYVSGSGPIWLDGVSCTGFESNLLQCSHKPFGDNDCSHSEDVYIHCLEKPTTSEYSVRLEGGPDASEGRLEVFLNGRWGLVCDDKFDDDAAEVVCRQLGYNHGGESVLSLQYGSSEGEIMLEGVICSGWESSLKFCSGGKPGSSYCRPTRAVGVKCNTPVSIGAVIGGVLGSLAVLVFIAMIACYAKKRTSSNGTGRRANPALSTTTIPFQYTVNLQYNNTTPQTGSVGPAGTKVPPISPGVCDGPPKYAAIFSSDAQACTPTADPAPIPLDLKGKARIMQ